MFTLDFNQYSILNYTALAFRIANIDIPLPTESHSNIAARLRPD